MEIDYILDANGKVIYGSENRIIWLWTKFCPGL